MTLWILRPVNNLPIQHPWKPWYDKTFGFVIRAESEHNARLIADENAGSENHDSKNPWLNSEMSTCLELLPYGEEEEILRDFASA